MKNCHGYMLNEIGSDEIGDETMDFFPDPLKPLVWPSAAIPKKIIEPLRAIAVATTKPRP
jgi:hypothetical protein